MQSILDSSSYRLLELVFYLVEKGNRTTLSELSAKFKVSEKTIKDDLELIMSEYSDYIDLTIFPNSGISVNKVQSNLFFELQSMVLKRAGTVQLILLLIEEPDKELSYYADKLFISLASVYRYVDIVNKYLYQYGIEIKGKNSRYKLVCSDEFIGRLVLSNFLIETLGTNSKLYTHEKKIKFIQKRIDNIFLLNGEENPEIQNMSILSYYYLSIMREQQGNTLFSCAAHRGKALDFDPKEQVFILNEFKIEPEILIKIESYIYLRKYKFTYFNYVEWEIKSKQFVQYLDRQFDLKINQSYTVLEENLLDVIYNLEKYTVPFRLFNDPFENFLNKVKESNLRIYKILNMMIEEFTDELSLDFVKYRTLLIFYIITSYPEILQIKLDKKTLIVSSYSKEHSLFMFKRLENELDILCAFNTEYTFISLEELDNYNLSEFEWILTNTSIQNKTSQLFYGEVTVLEDFPTRFNLKQVEDFLIYNISFEQMELSI